MKGRIVSKIVKKGIRNSSTLPILSSKTWNVACVVCVVSGWDKKCHKSMRGLL